MDRRHRLGRPMLRASGETSASKTFTFDRQAFVDCSTRMKRLAPTLDRKQNMTGATRTPSSDDYDYDSDSSSSSTNSLRDRHSDREEQKNKNAVQNQKSGWGFPFPNSNSNAKFQQRVSPFIEEGNLSSSTKVNSLPSNGAAVIIERQTSSKRATFPTATRKAAVSLKSKSERSFWMKPIEHLVTFMSSIGRNVDITSYHP